MKSLFKKLFYDYRSYPSYGGGGDFVFNKKNVTILFLFVD